MDRHDRAGRRRSGRRDVAGDVGEQVDRVEPPTESRARPSAETFATTRFGTFCPAEKLSDEAFGATVPPGWTVTQPVLVGDTAVTVRATAETAAGIPSRPTTLSVTDAPARTAAAGAPRPLRVSRIRCAGSACMPPGSDVASTVLPVAGAAGVAVAPAVRSADVPTREVVVVRSADPARSRRVWVTSVEPVAAVGAAGAVTVDPETVEPEATAGEAMGAEAPAVGTAYAVAAEGDATRAVSVRDAARAAATARRVGMRVFPCFGPPTVVRPGNDRGQFLDP